MKNLSLLMVLIVTLMTSVSRADTALLTYQPPEQLELTSPSEELNQIVEGKLPIWSEPIFGPEFTFSKPGINRYDAYTEMCVRCRQHLVDNQPEGAKFSNYSEFFTSPNGWGFTVSHDPDVVEVQMNPMTVEKYKKYQGDIQDAIFASASNVGLFPFLFTGGGHISIGWDTFSHNVMLLRNFLVDFYNHNELAMGVFNYDPYNAVPIQLDERFMNQYKLVIEKIDRGEMTDFAEIRAMLSEHFMRKDVFTIQGTLPKARSLYSQLDLDTAGRRFEIRAVRPQASMDVFVKQISLLRDRLHYLYQLNKPIEMKLKVKIQSIDLAKHRTVPPVNAQEALQAFYEYVSESGQPWSDHRDYLWPNWISSGELTKFEASEWFKHAEADKCKKLLQLH